MTLCSDTLRQLRNDGVKKLKDTMTKAKIPLYSMDALFEATFHVSFAVVADVYSSFFILLELFSSHQWRSFMT